MITKLEGRGGTMEGEGTDIQFMLVTKTWLLATDHKALADSELGIMSRNIRTRVGTNQFCN